MRSFRNSFLLFTFLPAFWGCNHQEPSARLTNIRQVMAVEAMMQGTAHPIHTSGLLASKTEMKLGFKTGGIIERIDVHEGQTVQKAMRLASLNLAEIAARKEQASQAYDKAVRDFQRVENLYRDSVATLEHLQDARTAREVARTNLEIADFNLRYSVIEAPANGKILLKLAEENEIVAAGQPVFLFGTSGEDWVVKVGLPDRDIVRVSLNDRARIRFDAYPGQPFEAVVTQLGQAADPYTGTYEVELTLQHTPLELVSGFMANAEILPPQSDSCLQVPIDALVEAGEHLGIVFVVTGPVVHKRTVTIAGVSENLCIMEGLTPGELVVTEGAPYLNDGDSVIVIRSSQNLLP